MDDKARLRADFEQLTREYKSMESMRKAYSDESLGIIRKQRDMIEKLQRDIESLKAEIDLETRYVQRKSVSDDTLSTLRESIESYTGKVDVEKRNITQLTKQIDVMKNKILEKRKTMGGVNASKENQKLIQKQIRVLENRLDKALVKFNEALATNKTLRKEIDDLRQERVVFDNIYRKLEKQLQAKKKAMANIIEVSNQAYEARDSAQMEIAAIQQSMNRERSEFEEHVLALNREIDTKVLASKDRPFDHTEAGADEEDMKAAASKASASLERDRLAMMATKDKVASYEEGFNKIRAATGISGIEELVTTFISNEDQNFSLFNYVAEQNNEIERLEEGIARLREEASKHSQESGDDVHQHKQLLKDLEARLGSTDSTAEKYEIRYSEASKTINSLKGGIQSLFTRIGCNEKAMSEMLADNVVTENTMLQFLGVIEQRTNEIMQKLATKKRSDAVEDAADEEALGISLGASAAAAKPGQTLVSLLGSGPHTEHGSDMLAPVDPPKVDDYDSDGEESVDDTDARPLSMKELKDKTLRSMSRGGKR